MLQPAQWKQIVESIRGNRCVPFLGAAANAASAARNYKGLPLGVHVAKTLAAGVKDKVVDQGNLPKVSLIYERAVERLTLIEEVKKQLDERNIVPSKLLTVLAALPLDLYITTNYDRLLERALEPRKPFVVVQTVDALEGREQIDEWVSQKVTHERPLVYKIHGSFKDLRPPAVAGDPPIEESPLIITEDDYIDFLTLLGSKESGIPPVITSRLARRTLLFLGYSLEDWDFRVIYKLAKKAAEDQKFAPPCYSVQKDVPDYWEKFWLGEKVKIIEGDIYDFADGLEAEWNK